MSTYTSLGIEKMVTGQNAGTWGDKTNANLDLLAQLTGGFAQLSIASGATTALTVADGALTGTAQQRFIEFTGTIGENKTVTIPNDVETFYILKNSTSGAYTVTFKYATGSGDTFVFSTTNKKVVLVQASASPDATNPNIIEINNQDISIVTDTTPQLGGNLDVNGNSIVSVSAGNIAITPDGAGKVIIDGISHPTADGTCGQALVTNGSGVLSFASVTGRTGAVNWCTTAKTGDFAGVNGNGYFVNTGSGAVTVTLPSSPSAGDIVAIKDYTDNFGTNNVIIARNGSKINSFCNCARLTVDGESTTLVYVDGTRGWKSVQNSQTGGVSGAQFVAARGGLEFECGDFRTHVFKGDSNFVVDNAGNACGSNTVDYFVIAGGGGAANSGPAGGAGGAGGARVSNSLSLPAPLSYPNIAPAGVPVSVQSYPITVGAGAAKQATSGVGNSGGNSVFSTITSAGGGGAGLFQGTASPLQDGVAGGSGGGGASDHAPGPGTLGGAGNTPPVAPPQGNNGGNGSGVLGGGSNPVHRAGGGGGGGNAAGSAGGSGGGGDGGAGIYVANAFFAGGFADFGTTGPVTGARYFAGGGGGAAAGSLPNRQGDGGDGGGGAGSQAGPSPETTGSGNGEAFTGGGAGGIGTSSADPTKGFGGSGLVAIRYKFK
jgi:hypothetical protein|tara:strand:+ start:2643 stop:4619 length:1977 start_codon:yes stop_codon:yes gene_type:complete